MGLLIRFAGQWVAGETREDAIRVGKAANRQGVGAILNYLGEHYREEGLVEAATQEYVRLVRAIREGGIRGGVSAKPTQLGILLGRDYCLSRFLVLLDTVRANGQTLWIDMEGSATTEDTIRIYERLLERHEKVGLCLQANLRRTEADLRRLLPLGARIRLAKGAYREPPEIAFTQRAEIDRRFLRGLEILFWEGKHFAVASHDGRMIQRALELAESHGTPFEFQMLQGVRDPLKLDLVAKGHRVQEYVPYGPNWLPYFLRRLRERPQNVLTMARSIVSA